MKYRSTVLRVPYDFMLPIFTALEQALVDGRMDSAQFNAAWTELLSATGWSDDEITSEVDRRWTTAAMPQESFIC